MWLLSVCQACQIATVLFTAPRSFTKLPKSTPKSPDSIFQEREWEWRESGLQCSGGNHQQSWERLSLLPTKPPPESAFCALPVTFLFIMFFFFLSIFGLSYMSYPMIHFYFFKNLLSLIFLKKYFY